MDKPPWADGPAADARPTAQRARAFWAVAALIALLFVAIGVRRQTVNIGSVSVSADGRTLSFGTGTCDQNEATTVEESPTTVRTHATADRAFCGGTGACASVTTVRLDEPLGDRQVIDASTGGGVMTEMTEEPP